MPYCPDCKMEFIEGIETCTDCGKPLTDTDGITEQYPGKKRREERVAEWTATGKDDAATADTVSTITGTAADTADTETDTAAESQPRPAYSRVYVKKAQQYEDFKSSASAFFLIGAILTVASILSWTGLINLPLVSASKFVTQTLMTLIGLVSLFIAAGSMRSARAVESQVQEEEDVTRQLIAWFLDNQNADAIDAQLIREGGFTGLSPEEQSLKRFDLIQDIFITNFDLQDQSYVDLLAEEIYDNLFD